MGNRVTIKQNNFSHGMQSDTKNKNLVGQTQVFGAERIKHFDIYSDNSKLTPNPSFERFNTDTEKELGIVALGGGLEDTVIYGLGKGLDNWIGRDWSRRIQLTPDATTAVDYVFIDLSNLGSDFWDNVNADGSDIRITTTAAETVVLDSRVEKFNAVTETGFVLIKKTVLENLYIYFGNANAESDLPLFTNRYEGFFQSATYAYSLDGNIFDLAGTYDLDQNTPLYGGGRIGQGLTNSNVSSLSGASQGTSATLSFHVKTGATPSFTASVSNSDVGLYVGAGNKLFVNWNTEGANLNADTGFTVLANTDYYMSVTGGNPRVYVNGVQVYTIALDNDLDNDTGQNQATAGSGNSIEFFLYEVNGTKTNTEAVNEGLMMSDPTFFTASSVELFSGITRTYSGIGIYYKDIAGTEWKDEIYQGNPIKDTNTINTPFPSSFGKDVAGFYFITSTSSELNGIDLGGRAGFDDTLIDVENTVLGAISGNRLPVTELAADKEFYISEGSGLAVYAPYAKTFKYFDDSNAEQTVSYDVGWESGVYDSFPLVESLVRYGNNLAIGGHRNNKSSIEIWNLLGLDSETVIEIGTGKLRVLANVQGSLIGVVDNFLTSSGLSNGKPSLDFRAWTGRDSISTLQSFKFDVDTTTYPELWQSTLDNRRISVRNASVFQVEPKTDWKGLWAIGIGELDNQLGISIPYDTEPIGRALSYHSAGNNILFITEDFEIHKINNDEAYTSTSVFDTMLIDGGINGVKKDIVGAEIILDKDLPAGQTVTLKYSVDGGAFETVGVCTERVTEFMFANGSAFNDFNDVQLRIESTGGDASIVEWSLKVEYHEEVV